MIFVYSQTLGKLLTTKIKLLWFSFDILNLKNFNILYTFESSPD